jgi:AraC-like DNA-binding protein
MEILILQYALTVLICLWWLKPLKKVTVGKHLKISLFNLVCASVLLFMGSYILIRELKTETRVVDFYSILFLCINMFLFAIVPAGYLYLRNQFARQHPGRKDLIHLMPLLLYTACFVLPYFSYRGTIFSATDNPSFLFTIFGYSVIGIYILLVIKLLLGTYLASLGSSKKGKDIPIAHTDKSSAETAQPQRQNEVLVGSVHFDAGQLTKMDETLRNFFLVRQPFLKRGYNLKQLSEDISIPLHHLSAFINQYYHIHFNDFINEYRVQYCQVKIKNDEWRSKTLEAIAEESGFNNRNTFTAAFKKVTGSNPSDFLRTVKQQQIA